MDSSDAESIDTLLQVFCDESAAWTPDSDRSLAEFLESAADQNLPTVMRNERLTISETPRITTRVLVNAASGAKATEVWQQWMKPGGFIPLHYHEVEEVLILIRGRVELTQGVETTTVEGPATILVPPRQLHGMKQVGEEQVELLAFFPTVSPGVFSPEGKLVRLPWQTE